MSRVAIIGAGLAGLACAARLRAGGVEPVVFDKSRGLGGRLATRRVDDYSFDHGAPVVHAGSTEFDTYLRQTEVSGAATRWSGAQGGFVGTPGMTGLVKPLAEGLDIRRETLVDALGPADAGWRLGAGGASEVFDRVVLAIPAPQARSLLDGIDVMPDALATVSATPCWAVMIATTVDLPDLGDYCEIRGPQLSLIVRNETKPGRAPAPTTLTVHATTEWSGAHLEMRPDEVCARLTAEVEAAVNADLKPGYARAHRWRYARTGTPLGQPYLANDDGTLIVGGDWALGAQAEDAFASGLAMARRVLDDIIRETR